MPTVTLAPLGLGELLDQTFSYYRKHFWLFAGIMAIPKGMLVGLNILIQVWLNPAIYPHAQSAPHPAPQAAQAMAIAMHSMLAAFGLLIPYFVLYTLALGASTYALSEIYLGRTATIRQSYGAVRRKLGRLLNLCLTISLRTFGLFILVVFALVMMIGAVTPLARFRPWLVIAMAFIAIFGLIASGVLAVMFLVRYCVAVPALVLEKVNVRQALKRSVNLTKGRLWQLLIVAVLMWLISLTLISLCQAPFTVAAMLVTVKGGHPSLWLTIPTLLLGGAAAVATAPLFMISFAIAYYDLRVRKEGFDLQLMMSQLDDAAAPSFPGQFDGQEGETLEEGSVPATVLLTLLTGGIYQPVWFFRRRKALNNLNSPEKLGVLGLSVALVGFLGNVLIPIAGSFVWGSAVQAENVLGPVHPAILLIAGTIIVVHCFKVRRILLDHLAPREDGMFSASIRFQYEDLLSRIGTFFLGIFYLQFEINSLLDRLAPYRGTPSNIIPLTAAESLPPSMIS